MDREGEALPYACLSSPDPPWSRSSQPKGIHYTTKWTHRQLSSTTRFINITTELDLDRLCGRLSISQALHTILRCETELHPEVSSVSCAGPRTHSSQRCCRGDAACFAEVQVLGSSLDRHPQHTHTHMYAAQQRQKPYGRRSISRAPQAALSCGCSEPSGPIIPHHTAEP